MGKAKSKKRHTDQGIQQKDQFHGIKDGSIKKNKDPKFKNTPMGKIALINKSKMNKNVPSQKNIQKNFTNIKNKNQNSPKRVSKNTKRSIDSPRHNLSNEAENNSVKGKFIFNPKNALKQFDDSDSQEITSQEDISSNKMDETFEDEKDSDTDIPDIFGTTLRDESDEDDEDFEGEEEEEEDDDDSDEEETVKYKGIKMFGGLKSKAKKNDADEDEGNSDDNDDNEEESDSDDNMSFFESDDEDSEEDEEEDEGKEEMNNDEKQIQNVKNLDQDISSMETDEDDEADNDYDDADDYDNDNMNEEMGLKTLLEKSIADDDDDDDEDFNEEDEEDDDDDDISSTDEDDEAIEYGIKKPEIANERDTLTPEKQGAFYTNFVFVENISIETTKGTITKLFSKYGTLKHVHLEPFVTYISVPDEKGSIKTPKLISFQAKLVYETKESAVRAAAGMHGVQLEGNYLIVQTFDKFHEPYDIKKTVLVTNLKRVVTVNEIWETFVKCGDIDCVNLIRHEEMKYCKYGYIHFFTEKAVAHALKLSNVAKIMGVPVIVLKVEHPPYEKRIFRNERLSVTVSREKFQQDIMRDNLAQKLYKKMVEHYQWHSEQDKLKKNSVDEPVASNAKREKSIKKREKQHCNNEEKESTAFQGQKVNLKNKKKKNKLDKKKKKMAGKLTAKSATAN